VESSGKGEDLKSLQKRRKPTLDILPGIPGQSTAIYVGEQFSCRSHSFTNSGSMGLLARVSTARSTVQTWAEAFGVEPKGRSRTPGVC